MSTMDKPSYLKNLDDRCRLEIDTFINNDPTIKDISASAGTFRGGLGGNG